MSFADRLAAEVHTIPDCSVCRAMVALTDEEWDEFRAARPNLRTHSSVARVLQVTTDALSRHTLKRHVDPR